MEPAVPLLSTSGCSSCLPDLLTSHDVSPVCPPILSFRRKVHHSPFEIILTRLGLNVVTKLLEKRWVSAVASPPSAAAVAGWKEDEDGGGKRRRRRWQLADSAAWLPSRDPSARMTSESSCSWNRRTASIPRRSVSETAGIEYIERGKDSATSACHYGMVRASSASGLRIEIDSRAGLGFYITDDATVDDENDVVCCCCCCCCCHCCCCCCCCGCCWSDWFGASSHLWNVSLSCRSSDAERHGCRGGLDAEADKGGLHGLRRCTTFPSIALRTASPGDSLLLANWRKNR